MKFWNIGANGQFIMGAIAAATVAFALDGRLPRPVTLILMAVAAAIGGGVFGGIVALFKVTWGTNETLLTLMLNYIAIYVLSYIKYLDFYRKTSDAGLALRPEIKMLPKPSAFIYEFKIGSVTFDISIIIAILLVIVAVVYFKKTKQGFEISVVGDSAATARYAGMSVNKVVVRTMFLSSAIIGLAGMLKMTGPSTVRTLSGGITSDVGWTAIIVAWIARLNPYGITVAAFLIAVLQRGSMVVESKMKISSATSDILEGIILFTVLAADFFIRYRIAAKSTKGDKK
jgi:simple sugar transport system permease protein